MKIGIVSSADLAKNGRLDAESHLGQGMEVELYSLEGQLLGKARFGQRAALPEILVWGDRMFMYLAEPFADPLVPQLPKYREASYSSVISFVPA